MSIGEFELISTYFKSISKQESKSKQDSVVLGIGDDGAVLNIKQGQQLVVTTDTLVAGVHFPLDTSPGDIAHKAIAVNLSDLAAMGAKPEWLSLSLAMPTADSDWLAAFSQEFRQVCQETEVTLIGGDTCRSPHLVITVTAQGFVACGQAILRSGAREGDDIYVTGTLGDASAGLALLVAAGRNDNDSSLEKSQAPWLIQRLNRPQARVEVGKELVAIASAAIDISDGLLADLHHVLDASGCGAKIDADSIPLSEALIQCFSREKALEFALAGGDDYELCFTAPRDKRKALEDVIKSVDCSVTRIGEVIASPGISIMRNNQVRPFDFLGYQHFQRN